MCCRVGYKDKGSFNELGVERKGFNGVIESTDEEYRFLSIFYHTIHWNRLILPSDITAFSSNGF
jgi:hypothetical protein